MLQFSFKWGSNLLLVQFFGRLIFYEAGKCWSDKINLTFMLNHEMILSFLHFLKSACFLHVFDFQTVGFLTFSSHLNLFCSTCSESQSFWTVTRVTCHFSIPSYFLYHSQICTWPFSPLISEDKDNVWQYRQWSWEVAIISINN